MDNLNQFRNKYGYNRKEGAYSQDDRLSRDKVQYDWDYQVRELERKRKEEEERRKREEERRKIEERNVNIDALDTLAKSNEQIGSGQVNSIPKGRGTNKDFQSEDMKTKKDKYVSYYGGFNADLRRDINERIATQKAIGIKDDEIKNSLIPEEDNSIQKRLDEISSKLKPGKEKFLYNIKEGWYEREVQNMLSKEYVRKMNGLSNNVDIIEKFLEENPEISSHITGDENVLQKFWKGGVRFLGSGTRLQYDSYKESAKDPMSYVWAGTILAASLMAAPVTGGASLAAAPLAASTPLLVSQMPLLLKSVASLTPMAALSFGMKSGALKNMSELEAGSAYREYLEEGIDHRIAAPIAATVGTFNGIIEYMQIDSALSAIPGVAELMENGSKMAQKELIKEITKVVTNYGIDLGANAIEEMAQAGVTELGLGLSRYMQDAPNPRTIGGLQALAKTMGSEDFRNTVLEEGYGALQSMWLSPIASSAGKVATNQALKGMVDTVEKSQLTKQLSLEEKKVQQAIKNDMDYILEKGGATDQAIRIVNETMDTGAIGFLMSETQILEDMLQREDITNQDKQRIGNTLEKINRVLSKTMYDAKEENPDMDYKPTNIKDVESDILSEGFLDNNEIYVDKLNNYNLELYKLAEKHNALDTIKEELIKGTNKAEIMDKVIKSFPRKLRRPLNIMSIINSVEMVQDEIKAQIVMNNLYNLSELHNNKAGNIKTDEITMENVIADEMMDEEQNLGNNDLTDADLREDTDVIDPIISPDTETPPVVAVEPTVDIGDEVGQAETETGENTKKEPLIDEKPLAESKFNPSDIKTVPINDINVDPDRFQFRYDRGNEGGATKKLAGAEYNPMLAGTILLWEDKHNDLYVVNGHHRVDLAKNSDIKDIDARIISHKEFSAEEARALGAMINIAEDNANSIDVAKLIRDTGITESDFKDVGIRPNSKIAKDGMALSKLNDWIFTQVATRKIPVERAAIIGQELGDNSDGQNQIVKAIDVIESKGRSITNDILVELIAEVKGTAREEFTEMTLFGEETFTKNYSLERAELVSYVKRQLRDRVSLLKNVSKNKNAAILKELGNTIAIDGNIREMNTADQALWIIDATLNYQGTKINSLFNELAREYAKVEPMNRGKVKRRALSELINLMEGGQLLNEVINQEVKREGIKDSILGTQGDGEGGQQTFGLSDGGLERQVNLFGEEAIMQIKEQPETKVIADEDVKKTSSFKATIPIVEAIKRNPIFNGLTIEYSNESGKVEMMSKEELIRHGYGHLEEKGEKYIYGYYSDGDRTITLNQEATRDTILEEAIHDIQHRLQEIDPDLNQSVIEWEGEVREKAKEHGITIPDGYELLAQSLVYTEFGYASTNPFIADLIAVDDEIVEKFRVLLGDEIADKGFGFVDSEVAKSDRLLNVNTIKKTINTGLDSNNIETYHHPDNGNYAMVHKQNDRYEISYFNEELGPIVDMEFDTKEEVSDKLIDDGIYQIKERKSIPYLQNMQKAMEHKPSGIYDRSVADELYKRLYLQRREGKDTNAGTRGTDISIKIDGWEVRKIREAINDGNFTLKDYQKLIENNSSLTPHTRDVLYDLVNEARKKGLDRPNSEVSLKQFLYRFYGVDIESPTDISNAEIEKHWIYYIDGVVEKKGYLDEAREKVREGIAKGEEWDSWYESLSEMESKHMAANNIKTRLKNQHKYFQEKIDTYRHNGLQYQIKAMDEKVNSPQFKEWFGDSKVVDERGKPLIVYHGTPLRTHVPSQKVPFSVFEKKYTKENQVGFGIHFTADREFADHYTEGDGHTFAVYLDIKNPLELDQIVEEGSELYDFALKANPNAYSMLNADTGKRNIYLRNAIEALPPKKAEKMVMDAGFDGVIYEAEMREFTYRGYIPGESAISYVVFNPTQIKSIENTGTFSPTNPDIMYQLKDSVNGIDQYTLEFGDAIYNDFIQGDKTTSLMYITEEKSGLSGLLVDRAIDNKDIYNIVVRDAVLEGYDYIKMGNDDPISITAEMVEEVMTKGKPLFQMKEEGTNGNLLVTHNLTEGKLKSAIKLGGFPVASFAITKKDQAHTNFGEISLIFHSDTIDPRNKDNKVYGADVYSPRFPRVSYNIDVNKMRDLTSRLQDISGINAYLDESQFSDMDIDEAATRLMSKDFMKVAFLNENKINIDIPMMDPDTRFQYNSFDSVANFIRENNLDYADIVGNEELREQYFKAIKEGYSETFHSSPDLALNIANAEIEKIKRHIEFDTKTEIYPNDPHVVQFTKDFNIAKGLLEQVKDNRKYNELIDKAISEKKEQFKEYIKSNIEPLYGEKGLRNNRELFTPSGNRRSWKQLHYDYNIDNVLKIMKGNMRDEEGFNYGLGNVRAGITEEFKTLDDIRRNQDLIVDSQTFKVEKERYNNIYNNLQTRSNEFHSVKYGSAFDYAMGEISKKKRINNDAVITALKGNEFRVNEMPKELITEIAEFIKDLKAMPTEYFEAIPQRIVELNEIQAVVAPSDLSIEMEQMLLENGINLIEKYESNDRQSAIDNILRENDLTFQLKDAWNNNDINEYYQMKEGEIKERSWGQTVRDSDITSQELRELLTNEKFMYEVKHNEDTILAAAKLIDEKGVEYVEGRLLSDLNNDAVLFAASQILTFKHMESGELDRAMALLDKTAEKATSAGQAIQILSVWGRQTPDGMLRYTASRFKKLMTDEQRRQVADKTSKLKDEFNRINREALDKLDFKESVDSIRDMPLDELVARNLAKYKEGQEIVDRYGLESILEAIESKDDSKVAEIDIDTLSPFLDGKTSIDDNMANRIIQVVNDHYKDGKGNLKNKLIDLGLNDFEAEILDMYIKNQVKEATKDSKKQAIDSTLSKQKYERKGLNEQIIDMASDGNLDESALRNLIGEKEGMPVLSKDLVDYIYQQGQHINSLEEGSRERDVATAKLMSEIASHIPSSFWEKVGTIQTMAHLLNIKTTLRNLIGNEMFSKIDTITHNYLGSPIDKLISLKTKQRTAIHRNIFKLLRTQYKGYGEGFRLGLEDALAGIDTSDEKSKFELRKTRTFKGGVLGSLETVLDITMRATDRAAFTAGFMDSIEEQMTIAGVDTPTDQMIDNATALGLYRTFNDETALSEAFRGGKKALNKFSSYVLNTTEFGLGDLVLKYPATPANILARAVDYSPAGVIMTMLNLYKDTSGDPYLRQRIAVEGISRALAGTSLIATGMILAKMGVVTGSDADDDEDIYKLQKQYGLRDYSVNVSAIKRHMLSGFKDPTAGELKYGDTIATYDWAEPIAISLAIGADTVLGKGDALSLLGTIVSATEAGAGALAEQPLLTGLSQLFRYGDPVQGVTSVISGVPSSFTPSLFSHIASFIDGSNKDPYSFYPLGRQAYNTVINKIPGLKGQLPDRYSVLGEKLRYYPEDVNIPSRLMRTIISPAIYGEYKPTKEAQLIFDLYEKTGLTDHIPRKPQKSYTIDKVKYTFTPHEYEELSKWVGGEVRARINYALNTYMRSWPPEDQVDEIRYIINELGKETRERVLDMKGVK